jgi:hypothetical protein
MNEHMLLTCVLNSKFVSDFELRISIFLSGGDCGHI